MSADRPTPETQAMMETAAQPHGVISDERIEQIYDETAGAMGDDYAHAGWLAFARALLAAAQEGK